MALNRLGYQRKSQLRMKNYLAIPDIVRRTDLALFNPLRLAQKLDLNIVTLLFEVQKLEWHLYWHKSADRDRANRRLRESIFEWAGESQLNKR